MLASVSQQVVSNANGGKDEDRTALLGMVAHDEL
jgi:hypothetical protein